jgi:MoxR-like ATPase
MLLGRPFAQSAIRPTRTRPFSRGIDRRLAPFRLIPTTLVRRSSTDVRSSTSARGAIPYTRTGPSPTSYANAGMLEKIQSVASQVGQVVVGKQPQIRLALACLLARGHLLIEDIPGVGKTTLAHALSISLGLQFKRVQFTNDLLPADIVGVSVFDRQQSQFVFHPGPVFSQVLLADEINRASPKTQSALLEAMEERQVSVDGKPLPLPDPFFVIATQNPQDQIGTFPLPESQLDRFLMCVELGYPDPKSERALLEGQDRRMLLAKLPARMTSDDLRSAQQMVREIRCAPALLDYVQNLLTFSRRSPVLAEGLSPRAGLGLIQAARAWAMLDGRNHVLPDDVQAVLRAVAGHRLRPAKGGAVSHRARAELVADVVKSVAIP